MYVFKDGIYKAVVENKSNLHFQYDRKNDIKFLSTNGAIYKVVNDSLELIDKGGYFFYPTSGDVYGFPFFIKDSIDIIKNRILYYYDDNKLVPIASNDELSTKPKIKDLKNNSIWISIRNQLDLPDNGNCRIVFNNEFPITNDVVKDNHNQFWIGSENGLGQIYNNAFKSIPANEISNAWTIIEDKNNNLWFGTYGNGMFMLPNNSNKIQSNSIGKSLHYFAGSAIDNKGKLYFGTNNGLEIIDGSKSEIIWNNKTVFSIHYDDVNDRIVFGTLEGAGILENEKVSFYGKNKGIHENYYIQSIGQDKNNNYWLGSYSGLCKLNPKTDQIKNYTLKNGNLPCHGVYCSFKDETGNFWIGGDNGLMIYNYQLDSITLLKSEVVNTMLKSIIDLDENNLLLATKDGLYIFDKKKYLKSKTLDFKILNVTNGYKGIDPGFVGMYKDSKGFIWITSATTIDRLDPRNLILKDQHLKAMITHVNGKAIPFLHNTSIIEMPMGESNIVIKYEAIGFTRPLVTKYQYRLNGGAWSAWNEESEAVLKDLENGNYIFEVRAGPSDLAGDKSNIDQFKFSIHLPFYLRNWFPPIAISLSILLLMLTAFYFIRQRIAQKKYKAQLEEAKYLRSQLLLSQLNPHFIFNVLANIQNKILFDKKEEASKGIVNLSKLLRNFLNASYKGSNVSVPGIENEIPLSTEIELLKSYIEFEQNKNDNHFEYYFDYLPEFLPENYSIPPLLLQPFVENAIKHGLLLQEKRGNLWIRFRDDGGDLFCIIEDDGVGIAHSQNLRKETFLTHKSLGSKIVKERVNLLNELGYIIEINIIERKPQGTIIEIIFRE